MRFLLIVGTALAGLIAISWSRPLLHFRLLDFEHYVLASRLLWRGQSPYGTVEFFAPPWLALLLVPFLLLPAHVAPLVWILVNMSCVCGAAILSVHWLGLSSLGRWKPLSLLCIALMPASLFCYVTGQISPLVGLAVLLAAWQLSSRRPRSWVVAVGLVAATVKPHIVLLPALLCILELVRCRNWRMLGWLAVGMTIVTVFAYVTDPNWFPGLVAAWQRGDFRGGKLGLVSPGYVGLSELGMPSWLFIPLGAYVLYQWRAQGLTATTTALAFSVSLLLVPYSRSYDYVVLVLPILSLAVARAWSKALALVIVVLSVVILPITVLSVLVPVLVTLGLLLAKATHNIDCSQ